MPEADLILHGGSVVTLDGASTIAEAVAVREGRIQAVGPSGEVSRHAGPGTRWIDLHGRTVTPGLVDAHPHVDREGLKARGGIPIDGLLSVSAIVEAVREAFASARPGPAGDGRAPAQASGAAAGMDRRPKDGDVVLAAITSCTNTSNPPVMIAAGLLARRAAARGLRTRPWVKTSIAPGSRVVSDYLSASGLQRDLDAIGFHLVGFGCTTCMGNSGPLPQPIAGAIDADGIAAVAVLSGNRNFEGRAHPQVRDSFLASPPLVVAYALAGTVCLDLVNEPVGAGGDGRPVHLRDIWPSSREVAEVVERTVSRETFRARYADIFAGGPEWQSIGGARGTRFAWDPTSTYVRRPPFFDGMPREPEPIRDIRDARPLVMLGDSVTTDHISPIGHIPADGEAGRYLMDSGVRPVDFNSFGARRANHDVMIRGTFSNARLRNEMTPDTTGGFTRHMPEGRLMTIFEAVIAGSFERTHRSNLAGMGVLPLEFEPGVTRQTSGSTAASASTSSASRRTCGRARACAGSFTAPTAPRRRSAWCAGSIRSRRWRTTGTAASSATCCGG